MTTDTVTLQIPANLYATLEELAAEAKIDPIDLLSTLVDSVQMRRSWLRDLHSLRRQIQEDGGIQVGSTQDEVLEHLRKTRQELFEADYAHLYR